MTKRRLLQVTGSILAVCLFLIITMLVESATAATYYLSTTGDDTTNSGTSPSTPWQTFAHAIPLLSPGDTLILVDNTDNGTNTDTYNSTNSGHPDIRCGTNAVNGTAAMPITVKAENERKAFIKGNGHHHVLYIFNCDYWTFEGLRIESVDAPNAASSTGIPVYSVDSSHLTFRRLLVRFNNRYTNSGGFSLQNLSHSILEENELYSYHRNGLSLGSGSHHNTVRRNYLNSRSHKDIPGGKSSEPMDKGDGGITIYPGSHNIIENNIVENTGGGFNIEASGPADDNYFTGNISLNNNNGVLFRAREHTPKNTVVENHVSLNSTGVGHEYYFRGNENTLCKNCTALNNQVKGGFVADKSGTTLQPSVHYENSLAVNNPTYGFWMKDQYDFSITNSNAYENSPNFSPSTHPNYTNTTNINPGLGTCIVYIPDTSPMKNAVSPGTDIGANVLYRYNGLDPLTNEPVLTDTPLWDVDNTNPNVPQDGFTCGDIVPGVNDLAGESCFDVHERLNVNFNGCEFPAGYGSSNTAPTVNAGAVQTITFPNAAALDGTVTDDGLPNPPATVTTAWSAVSGPGTVTFGDPANVDTTANFGVTGTYELRLTANDGELSDFDEVTIMVVSASFPLTVIHQGTGAGQITSNPPGLNCSSSSCSGDFADGTQVILTATPASGSTFDSWSGACSGTVPTCTVLLTQAETVTATFSTASIGATVIPQSQLSVASVSANPTQAPNALDGNPATRWTASGGAPYEMVLALGGTYQVSEFRYLPYSNSGWNRCTQYEVYVSASNGNWGPAVATGTWSTDSTEKIASFAPTPGAFLRVRYLDNYCYAAEHNVYGTATGG